MLPSLTNINYDLILIHLEIEVIFRLLPALCRSMLENGENQGALLAEICGLCVENRSYKDVAANTSDSWILQREEFRLCKTLTEMENKLREIQDRASSLPGL